MTRWLLATSLFLGNLMFKLVGKSEQSGGFGFDLIIIQCEVVE